MDLSVVVVTWNTRALVLECLASVFEALETSDDEHAPMTEVIVIDNGSGDGSAAAVRSRFPAAQLIVLSENRGFAAGCNVGMSAAGGRHVLLLNSDARANRALLDGCVGYLDRHPDVGIVGPQLLHSDGRAQNSIHNFPTLVSEAVPKAALQFCFRRKYPSWRTVGDRPIDVEAITGAALFVRAKAVREVGPMPEDYFFYLEETAWCLAMKRSGWRVVHLPACFAIHDGGASSKRRDPALARIEYHRSLYHFFGTNRGTGPRVLVMTLRIFKNLFAVVTRAPIALVSEAGRVRWKARRDVLAWHLRGCPESVGFAGVRAAMARRAAVPTR
jgi:GT2 family glycosyltransferase